MEPIKLSILAPILIIIHNTFGVNERTVRKWFALKTVPEKGQRNRMISLDSHANAIRKLASEYDNMPLKVFRRLHESGVTTSLRSVQR